MPNDVATRLELDRFLPYKLSVLNNRVSNAIARQYSERFQLSPAEWRVMAALGHTPDLSGREVAEKTAMDKVQVSRAVASLAEAGRLTRRPDAQDGRITLRVGGKPVDVRVSTLPTGHGERAVLRLLDKEAGRLDLQHLGMSAETLAQFDKLIAQPHGIVLVTGPTGSGKTTTLYAALSRLNDTRTNILTVEDPIEYELSGIGQTQVNPRIELTFAEEGRIPNYAPRWNIAPSEDLLTAVRDKHGKRRPVMMRWGLIPAWAKDEKIAFSTFNARAESIDTKPAFRGAWAAGRGRRVWGGCPPLI